MDQVNQAKKKNGLVGRAVGIVIGVALILGIPTVFFTMTATVEQGRVAVVTTFGNIVRVEGSGFHFKSPFDLYNIVDVTQMQVTDEYSTATKDLQSISQTITAQIQIDPSEVEDLYRSFLGNHVSGIVRPTLYSQFKSATAAYTIDGAITERSALEALMLSKAQAALEPYGIHVISVQIANVDLPAEYKAAVEEKMVAEQKLLTAQTQQQTATVQAETNRILAESLDNEILSKMVIDKWNGILPLYVGGDSNGLDILIPNDAESSGAASTGPAVGAGAAEGE